ncbi:NAD(P)-dependent oxidoreductase [Bordetella sputigena]|uniref:NAD-dependent epimerase/dehydratase family protein n=1 Tax=Bordetella sputigena TaxID=1416810 RepID=UPI0039EFEBDC
MVDARDGDERILLVGGGDLGQRVARRLRELPQPPARIWAARRNPPSSSPDIEWLAADVTRPETLPALPPDPTRVVVALSPGRREETAYRAVFIDGLRNVVERLDRRSLRRLVFVSSSAVYGDHGGDWVDEATPPAPPGMNGTVLLQAEQWLLAQGLPSTVLRLSGLYGPGRLQLLDRLRAGQARVPRATPHWANRMHADDAAGAIAHLLMLPDALPVYIGSDDTPLRIDVLYDFLADQLGCARPQDGPPPAGIGSKKLSNARLRASGYALAWPDARAGYAALLMPS